MLEDVTSDGNRTGPGPDDTTGVGTRSVGSGLSSRSGCCPWPHALATEVATFSVQGPPQPPAQLQGADRSQGVHAPVDRVVLPQLVDVGAGGPADEGLPPGGRKERGRCACVQSCAEMV